MKTILAAVDFSASTDAVLEAAARLARGLKARLVVVHVVPPPIILGHAEPFLSTQSDGLLEEEKRAQARLAKLRSGLRRDGTQVETATLVGGPVASLVAKARAVKADYLVAGSHGHGVVYDLLLGSTTRGLLQDAECPVLVIPSRPDRRASLPETRPAG